MSRKIDQLVRSSYTGCIDDRTEVAEIVTKFINQSLVQVLETADAKIKEVIETLAGCLLMEDWDLSRESMESLKYTELLCLIDNTKIDPAEILDNDRQGYNNIGVKLPQPPFRYLGLNDIYVLLKTTEKTNSLVKQFMSINVYSLFAYLKNVGNDGEVTDVWNILKRRADDLKINIEPNASMHDILYKADETWKSWNPWKSISDYYNKVIFVFEIFSSLLIDCFKHAYPEKFQMENIIKKYSNFEANSK